MKQFRSFSLVTFSLAVVLVTWLIFMACNVGDHGRGVRERVPERNLRQAHAVGSARRPSQLRQSGSDRERGWAHVVRVRRRPFPNGPSLQPEARYSVWYSGENAIRASRQLQAGQAADDGSTTFDFLTATVDPDDKTFWVALPFMQSFAKGPSFRMVVGKITP